jgi:RNA polymerase sigma factor (TIGR02999 family)
MSDVTRILSAIEHGDPSAAVQLLPLVYQELRKLAAQRLGQEKPGQTLQATALVHEAYLRLVDVDKAQHWNRRGHFFAAAAEAMRRILIVIARREGGPEAGGRHIRVELCDVPAGTSPARPRLARSQRIARQVGSQGPIQLLPKPLIAWLRLARTRYLLCWRHSEATRQPS